MEKNQPLPVRPMTVNISHSAGINLSTLIGDLNASVQMLQQQGGQPLAEAIEKLTNAIGNSEEIKAQDQKELLEYVAGISKEASSDPDHRNTGTIKACFTLLTTELSAAKEFAPLLHELYENLK